LARAERTGESVALLFIDLDGFKHVNDVYGHSAGDEVLREVAKRLQRVARQTDFIARMGGDEFVILLEGSVEIDTPSRVAERVLETLCPPIEFPGGNAVVGASIGIAVHPPLSNLAVDLIRRADAAMYSAKKAGKGCVRFASASE
jgi:diguanylate cyclase (GGDEF)-like protein